MLDVLAKWNCGFSIKVPHHSAPDYVKTPANQYPAKKNRNAAFSKPVFTCMNG